MEYIGKKIRIACLFFLTIAIALMSTSCTLNHKGYEEVKEQVGKCIYSCLEMNPVYGKEWMVITLALDGYAGDAAVQTYYRNLEKEVKNRKGILSERKYTDYARVAMTLCAMGKDPENIGGYSMIDPLKDTKKVSQQGINGPVWALIALTFAGYDGVEMDRYVDDLVDESRKLGAGWSMMGDGTRIEPDITCMAIEALAPYYTKRKDVKAVIDDALKELERTEDAGCESLSQRILAYTSLGIMPEDAWMDQLLRYALKDGMFARDGQENLMATEQGYMALVAYDRLKKGKGMFVKE